jgi:hypothetical protein
MTHTCTSRRQIHDEYLCLRLIQNAVKKNREKAKKADELKVKLEEATKKIAKLEADLEKLQATLEKERKDAAAKLEQAIKVCACIYIYMLVHNMCSVCSQVHRNDICIIYRLCMGMHVSR